MRRPTAGSRSPSGTALRASSRFRGVGTANHQRQSERDEDRRDLASERYGQSVPRLGVGLKSAGTARIASPDVGSSGCPHGQPRFCFLRWAPRSQLDDDAADNEVIAFASTGAELFGHDACAYGIAPP